MSIADDLKTAADEISDYASAQWATDREIYKNYPGRNSKYKRAYDENMALVSRLRSHAQALADGRTACVEVLTEDECRAEFIKWARGAYEERQCVFDPQGVFFNPEVAVRWGAWFACARAMGAVR